MTRGNVLVVDDDESVRTLLMEYLTERAGLRVDGARDGVDALHQISSKPYSVVVLDVMMPYMSGIDLLDSLGAMLSDPSVKSIDEVPDVVIVTSISPDEMPETEVRKRFPFVRRVLRKPVDPSALVSLL